jgi:hypothetical protein
VWGYRLRNMKILCLKAPLMLALALYGVVAPIAARSWDDLDEGETEIYGREREEKLPLRLFFVQKEKWEGHEALHILWLYGYTDYPRYRSDRLLPFYYRLQSKTDNRYRFVSPVYFHERDGADNDRSLLWLYYWGADTDRQRDYSLLLPLYYRATRAAERRSLFVSPLYARETYASGSDSTIAWLIYWGEDSSLSSSHSTVLPLYFHRKEADISRTLVTPLFWYTRTGTAEMRRMSWGAPLLPLAMYDTSANETDLILLYLFRHRSRADATLSYLLPLYYYSRRGENSTASYLFPLIWVSDSPDRSSWFIFPLFYSADMQKGSTRISPVYISLAEDTNTFKLLFPLYFNYRTKDYSLHVNATGLSLSEEELALSPASLELSREKIVLDSNFGWFYNLFRISSRHTLRFGDAPQPPPLPQTEAAAAPAKAKAPSKAKVAKKPAAVAEAKEVQGEPQTARIARRRERTRADSENFFGWYMLFGATAYERADHYRHFRLLPLSWLTWNTQNDQGVQTIIPFYVHYRDESTRYLVLFPVYGAEQTFHVNCTGNKTAWLIIGYWNEYDCETQTTEQTVLWPVYNRYFSPTSGGFRIFPVFWKKWRSTPEGETQVHFSPLHYTTVNQETFKTVSWLFYRSRFESGGDFGIWGLAHFARRDDDLEATNYIFPVYHSRQSTAETADGGENRITRRSTLMTVAALFWRYHAERAGEHEESLHASPLYFWYGDRSRGYFYSWLFYRVATPGATTQGVPLIYHSKTRSDATYSNFYLIPFYRSQQAHTDARGNEYVTWLFPLYYAHTSAIETKRFIGYYYYERSETQSSDHIPLIAGVNVDRSADQVTWHTLLWTIWYQGGKDAKSFRLGYGLVHSYEKDLESFSWHIALATGYKRNDAQGYLRHHLLPLWWYSNRSGETNLHLPFLLATFQSSADGNRVFRAILLGVLYYQNSDYAAYDQTLGVAMGTLYYHNKYTERRFDSYGSVYGLLWHYETEDNYKRLSLLTFIYIRTETEKGVRHRLLGIPL